MRRLQRSQDSVDFQIAVTRKAFGSAFTRKREDSMRLALSCALLVSALIGLSACNKAESPEKVQADVAKAKSDAAQENAKADEKVKQVEGEAAKDRADAEAKVADKSVGALVDSAV